MNCSPALASALIASPCGSNERAFPVVVAHWLQVPLWAGTRSNGRPQSGTCGRLVHKPPEDVASIGGWAQWGVHLCGAPPVHACGTLCWRKKHSPNVVLMCARKPSAAVSLAVQEGSGWGGRRACLRSISVWRTRRLPLGPRGSDNRSHRTEAQMCPTVFHNHVPERLCISQAAGVRVVVFYCRHLCVAEGEVLTSCR